MRGRQPAHADTQELSTQLRAIIEKCKGGDTPSDKDVNAFKDAWVRLVRETGMTDEMVGYLFDGFRLAEAKPLYLFAITSGDAVDAYRTFLGVERARRNVDEGTIKTLFSLLALELSQPNANEALDFIATSIPRYNMGTKQSKKLNITKYVVRFLANNPISDAADMHASPASALLGFMKPPLKQIVSGDAAKKRGKPNRKRRADISAAKTLLGWLEEHARARETKTGESTKSSTVSDNTAFDDSDAKGSVSSSPASAVGQDTGFLASNELAVVDVESREDERLSAGPESVCGTDGVSSSLTGGDTEANGAPSAPSGLGESETLGDDSTKASKAEVPSSHSGVTVVKADNGEGAVEVSPTEKKGAVAPSTEQQEIRGAASSDDGGLEPADTQVDNDICSADSAVDVGDAQPVVPEVGSGEAQMVVNPNAESVADAPEKSSADEGGQAKPLAAKSNCENKNAERLEDELREARRTIAELMEQRASLSKSYGELLSRFDQVQRESTRMRESLEHAEKTLSMLREHKAHQTVVADQKLMRELKFEYQDYQDAIELDMTIDLGENMRDQLGNVFEMLIAAGIDL